MLWRFWGSGIVLLVVSLVAEGFGAGAIVREGDVVVEGGGDENVAMDVWAYQER